MFHATYPFHIGLRTIGTLFNSSITFQLEQPFNPTINTIGTGMNHPMNPRTPFQRQPFKIIKKKPKRQNNRGSQRRIEGSTVTVEPGSTVCTKISKVN